MDIEESLNFFFFLVVFVGHVMYRAGIYFGGDRVT